MGSPGKRTRGPNKQTPWSRVDQGFGDGEMSVLRLALDVSDPLQRLRLESMFDCAYSLQRAVQRDARARLGAYWNASHERAKGPKAVRDRLGLSKKGFEEVAAAHVNGAPHLRRFVTKALAQHIADAVWTAAERHLFRDASGKRQGMLRIGRWYDFTRLVGRAQSHTKKNKRETFRLHGTLAGHRTAYTKPDGDLAQPRRLRIEPMATARAWWSYEGPFAIVFSGLGDGTLVLPVRLPTAPCNQPALDYYLADPSKWHKIDVVRHPDAHAPGGWRYEAHLVVLLPPYVSSGITAQRAQVAIETLDRTAGIDVNVSNLSIASHDTGRAMRLTAVARDTPMQQRDRGRRKRERRRQREIERSRRANNRAQYHLSKRQEKAARRRAERGLAPVEVIPMGPRKARADGVPLQSFRQDELSARFRRLRKAQAAEAEACARARRDHARQVAREVVATHGTQLVVEDCSIAAWSRTWGRALAAFSPGILVEAIDREARAVAALAGGDGGVVRAATRPTALSQHCPCGERVGKTLADRIHDCPSCKLLGDRDAVAAVLASFVVLLERGNASSARVDYAAASDALPEIRRLFPTSCQGWQDTLSESTDLSARDGSFIAWATSTPGDAVVARRIVGMASCSTLDETGLRRTTSDRACARTNTLPSYVQPWTNLRDVS